MTWAAGHTARHHQRVHATASAGLGTPVGQSQYGNDFLVHRKVATVKGRTKWLDVGRWSFGDHWQRRGHRVQTDWLLQPFDVVPYRRPLVAHRSGA